METVIEFLNLTIDAVNNAGDTFDTFAERSAHWALVAYLELKLWALEFSYGIAKTIIQNLGISAAINSAFAGIDSTIVSALIYLRVPEGLNMMISAAITRFIMDMLP